MGLPNSGIKAGSPALQVDSLPTELPEYIKWITFCKKKKKMDKDLLYSTENSTQYSIMTFMGKESTEEWIYVYITDSHCCISETNTTL